MTTDPSVITVFARNGGRILVSSGEAGRDGITRPLEDSPQQQARAIVDDVFSTASGGAVAAVGDPVTEGERERRPVLIDVFSRDVPDGSLEWRHAPDLQADGAPGAWDAYRRVRPSIDGVHEDDARGSAALSLAALEVLRDAAATGATWSRLTEIGTELVEGSPSLTALGTRVDRTMSRAASADSTPSDVERIAREEIDEAVRSDEEAAARVAAYCEDATVLTISRSGTVQAALSQGDPDEVILLESRPNCEAVSVAETLAAEGMDVSLLIDAAVGDVLARRDVDVALIGADSVDPNGDVRNKVGTRMLAMAAERAGVPVIAATSTDKVARSPCEETWIDGRDVYDGPADIDTRCRLFDRTPPDLIDELVTEDGPLAPSRTIWIAAERRRQSAWRERPDRLQSV